MNAPSLSISFDFELGWGVIENGRWALRQRLGIYRELRTMLPRILALLEARDVGADWAAVGAMCVEPARRSVDHLPDGYASKVTDFLRKAEQTTYDGRDLAAMVAMAPSQRVVSHGFSHVVLTRNDVSPATSRDEALLGAHAIRDFDGIGSVFVYPENRVPAASHREAMSIDVYRAPPDFTVSRWPAAVQKALLQPRSYRSLDEIGVSLVTGSALFKPRGHGRLDRLLFSTQASAIVRRLRAGQDQCVWVHPFNFVEYPGLLGFFERLLDEAVRLRDRDALVVARL